MELTIKITMDNAAFAGYPEIEVKRLLEKYCHKLDARIDASSLEQVFVDVNGNKVGKATVTE